MPKLSEILGEETFKALPEEVRTKYAETDLVDSKDYTTVEKFNAEVAAKNTLQTQLTERDTQLTNLKNDLKGKDAKAIGELIEQLETENKTAKTTYEGQLAKQKLDFAIELALRDAGAKNAKAIMGLLKAEDIKQDGEKLLGFDDQVKALKESDGYLFSEEVTPTGTTPNTNGVSTPEAQTTSTASFMSAIKEVQAKRA